MKPKRRFLVIQDAHDAASARGGKCLSSELSKGIMTMVSWECKEGHQWVARLNNVRNQGQWCPQCSHVAPLSLQDAHDIAAAHDGQCISTIYVNYTSPLDWTCKNGHTWSATMSSVRGCSQWCRKCHYVSISGSSFSIEDAQRLATSNGGECLSTAYVDIYSKLEWRCDEGHEWKANLNAIKNNGYWCRKCKTKKSRKTWMANYGVDNPNKDPAIRLKGAKACNNYVTLFHWKTNEEVICQGSYERRVVEYLNRLNIDFRWQVPFALSDGRTYIVDFYDVSRDVYVEIKGWWRDDARDKHDLFRSDNPGLAVEVWDKSTLKELNI